MKYGNSRGGSSLLNDRVDIEDVVWLYREALGSYRTSSARSFPHRQK